MYEFTQDCLTGIDQIDEEHRKLFSLINEAVELPKEARTPQTVKNILEHLSDYAVNHFAICRSYFVYKRKRQKIDKQQKIATKSMKRAANLFIAFFVHF